MGYNPIDPTSFGIFQVSFNLIVLIPSISVTIRRLHDVNKSGWNLLWYLTIIMTLYILYLNMLKGTDGDNKYGSPSTL